LWKIFLLEQTMPNAIRFHQVGGPEVLQFESASVGDPGAGQARVRHTAVGLNYIDTYQRSGLYKLPLPSGLGSEAAGVVEAVGPGVSEFKTGDRVAYSGGAPGAYAEVRVMPIDRLVKLPEGVSDRVAATLMLKGLTVQYLLRQTYTIKAGETILLHAAAGGIGLIACQWARALGVTVIGTVGSDAKAELAKANGCTHTIVYTRENFVEKVKEITGGKGVPVVYDAVGKDTFPGSLDCLSPRGLFVSFGNSSGPVPPFEILLLSQKGSLYATRPTLATYTAKRADLLKMAEEMFALVQSGKLKNEARQTYPLKDAAQAHRDLESRKTTGSTIMLP
jgi:NADPH:quinone reductase